MKVYIILAVGNCENGSDRIVYELDINDTSLVKVEVLDEVSHSYGFSESVDL